MTERKKLNCYSEDRADLLLRPAPHRRDWMDASPDGYAYRCLPLAIANAHAWEVLNPSRFEAVWDGGKNKNAITITHQEGKHLLAVSHFGEAVLTFHVPCLFNTPPGFDLFVTGPINRPKANIQPLTGVVETDWSPFSFTMNWMFTTPGERIVFEENEPIAAFFPIQRGVVESFEPVMKKPEDNAELWSAHMDWRESRTNFNQDLTKAGSDAQKQKWQKGYFGGPPSKVSPAHRTKLRLKDFSK